MYEKGIEIRWSDMDAYGHVNNATYLTYLEEARDEWMQRVLEDSEQAGFVQARVAIDFGKELTQDDDVVVARCVPMRTAGSRGRSRRRNGPPWTPRFVEAPTRA